MQKWEYLQISWHYDEQSKRVFALNGQYQKEWKNTALHELFNKYGELGWELVAFDPEEGEAFFKRPRND
ncbi:MAG: hypothetical protein KJ064_25740 [Anaerolineae bacterium]|jgi:hypothetical protein|nr:hypothetical protein [Anaerolineae bacterium]